MNAKPLGVIALSVMALFLVAVLAGFVIGRTSFRSSQSSPEATMPGGAGSTYPAPPEPTAALPTPQASAPGSQTGQEVLGGPQGASSGQTAPQAPPVPISPTSPPGVPPTISPASPPPPVTPAAPPVPANPAPTAPGTPAPDTVPPPFVVTPATGPAGNPAASPAGGRFHVQVGAFDQRQNAEALRLRIRSMGYAVTITDGPPYRVWVGAYLDRNTAERLIENLRAAGFEAVLSP